MTLLRRSTGLAFALALGLSTLPGTLANAQSNAPYSTATIDCSAGSPSYNSQCTVRVERTSNNSGTLTIESPAGRSRVLNYSFRNNAYSFSSPGISSINVQRNVDIYYVSINNNEYFEIPESLLSGNGTIGGNNNTGSTTVTIPCSTGSANYSNRCNARVDRNSSESGTLNIQLQNRSTRILNYFSRNNAYSFSAPGANTINVQRNGEIYYVSVNNDEFFEISSNVLGGSLVPGDQGTSVGQTITQCRGSSNTIRIYDQNNQVYMQASDQQNRNWLNSPARRLQSQSGTDYYNLQGESIVRLSVPNGGSSCTIYINNNRETGTVID